MKERSYAAPVVVVLIVLLLVYVGSYLALVGSHDSSRYIHHSDGTYDIPRWAPYRCYPRECEAIYWPLEKIDRRLRPDLWNNINR